MQLGARWRVGDPPHHGVPEALHDAIRSAERTHPEASSWTLTWLEGRPICTLDGILTIRLSSTGEITRDSLTEANRPVEGEDDDDWLS